MSSPNQATIQLPSKAVLSNFCAEQRFTSYGPLIAVGYSIILRRFLDVNTYDYLRKPCLDGERETTATRAGQRCIVQYNPDSTLVQALNGIKLSAPCDIHLDSHTILHQAFLREGGDNGENANNWQCAFTLILTASDVNEDTAVLEVNAVVFSKFQAQSIGRAFSQALHALTGNGDGVLTQPLAALDLLTREDHALISRWNRMHPVSSQECVPDLVERICTKYPQKTAVISSQGGCSLTYERLNKVASQLAHLLVTKYNLGRGAVIPLCFDKSPLAVVAMLAVLKTGAAYCCLDPQHPRARHDFILQAVKASLVLAGLILNPYIYSLK